MDRNFFNITKSNLKSPSGDGPVHSLLPKKPVGDLIFLPNREAKNEH